MILLSVNLINGSDGLLFGSDQSESSFAEHNKRSTLNGNAYIKTDTLDINADIIELYGKDYRFADCIDNVRIHNTKENFIITSEKMLYDNEKKEATITGNAMMKDEKNDMIIKGEYIKSFQETSITIIQIKVRIINEDLVCRSEFAEYNSNLNQLILTGDPIVYKGEDIFKASKITINLDNNDIIMEGKVKGSITEESQNEP
ncbi:MAG: hypothetical protein OCD02_19120 [Spirochaetaceae bacterium]